MSQRTRFGSIVMILALLSLSLVQCSKSPEVVKTTNTDPRPVAAVDLLPGPCPYDCHDTRCKAYSNGYCGTIDPPPPPPPPAPIHVRVNVNNPYESIGSAHNQGLASVMATVNPNSPTVANDIVSATGAYLAANGYDQSAYLAGYNTAVSLGYFGTPDPWDDMQASFYDRLVADGRISAAAENYLLSMDNVVTTTIGDYTIPTQTLYNQLCTSIIAIENTVNADATLSSADKQIVLANGSMLRYSAQYWGNYFASVNSAAVAVASKNTLHANIIVNPARRIFSWKHLFRADAIGAVTGGIAGGIAGGLGGIIPGILGGGLGESIAYAIFGDRVAQ